MEQFFHPTWLNHLLSVVPGHLEKPCPGTALFNEISAWFWLDLRKACAALAQRSGVKPWSIPVPLPIPVLAWALEAAVPRATALETVHPLSTTSWSHLLLTITAFSWCRGRMQGWSHPYSASWAQFSMCYTRQFAPSLTCAAQDCTIQVQELPRGCVCTLYTGRSTDSSL